MSIPIFHKEKKHCMLIGVLTGGIISAQQETVGFAVERSIKKF